MGFSQLSTKQEVNILLNTISWVHNDTMNIFEKKCVHKILFLFQTKYIYFEFKHYGREWYEKSRNKTQGCGIKPRQIFIQSA